MDELTGRALKRRSLIIAGFVIVVVAGFLAALAFMPGRGTVSLLSNDAATSPAVSSHRRDQQPAPSLDAAGAPVALEAAATITQLDEEHVRAVARCSFVRVKHARDGNVGCGVIVSTSRTGFDVITADHVIAEYDDYFLVAEPRESEPKRPREYRSCKTLLHDQVLDLAYVRVTAAEADVESLPLADGMDTLSSQTVDAWKIFFSDGGGVEIEKVTVGPRLMARRSASSPAVSYWKLDRPLAPGLSGSALIGPQGALMGIACGNSENVGYYCDEHELRKFFGRAGLAAGASK